MEDVLLGIPKPKITFASLGGTIKSTGIQVRGQFVVKGRIDINELNTSSGPPMPAPMTLGKFARSVCIVYEGSDIKRFDLIEYVRNKLGGGHFDTKRSKDTEVMLDAIAQQYQINDQNAIYHEFLAVGQNVASTPDIQRLLSAINENLSS